DDPLAGRIEVKRKTGLAAAAYLAAVATLERLAMIGAFPQPLIGHNHIDIARCRIDGDSGRLPRIAWFDLRQHACRGWYPSLSLKGLCLGGRKNCRDDDET